MASNPFDSVSAPSTNPFDHAGAGPGNPFSAFGDTAKGVGSKVLDLMGRTGDAGMAFASTPGDWNPKNIGPEFAQAGKNAAAAFQHGTSPATRQTQRDKVKSDFGIKDLIDKLPAGLPRGTADTLVDAAVDPATAVGGSGLLENLVNRGGRAAYIGAAKGMAHANPLSQAAGMVHDFVTPGGAEIGQLKRGLAASQGAKGLDKYVTARSAAKGAANAGTDVPTAVQAAFSKPKYKPGSVPGKPQYVGSTPTDTNIAEAFKPKGAPPTGRVAQIARAASKGAKAATRGVTDLMFVTPQLPGLQGHGSNILQTAFLSDPGATAAALGRFVGSGEAVPFSGARNAVQKLPVVRDLKAAQDASIARANASGANTVHPEDFGGNNHWTEKVPLLGMAARESNRSLQGWDSSVKAALNDKWTKTFLQQGYSPKVAAAKAADRVAQDVVDYSDKSDLTRALSHGLPFSTYATKKPGLIARAAVRHPERVLALTRNNPDFQPDTSQPMSDPDAGRPLSSIYNALNNKSPSAKGGAPYPGAQYQRASQGAPTNDLMGLLNSYFTYGPPAKHGDGDALKGWLKLLLSQTVGNVTGGDQVLNATGLNYFGK